MTRLSAERFNMQQRLKDAEKAARRTPEFTPGSIEQRTAFYASQQAIEALCQMCKQPQNAPSCERREHWGA